jgi:exoribonuclease-2
LPKDKRNTAFLVSIHAPATTDGEQLRDLKNVLWASIDDGDSLDLDQLTVAKAMPGDKAKNLVASLRGVDR